MTGARQCTWSFPFDRILCFNFPLFYLPFQAKVGTDNVVSGWWRIQKYCPYHLISLKTKMNLVKLKPLACSCRLAYFTSSFLWPSASKVRLWLHVVHVWLMTISNVFRLIYMKTNKNLVNPEATLVGNDVYFFVTTTGCRCSCQHWHSTRRGVPV